MSIRRQFRGFWLVLVPRYFGKRLDCDSAYLLRSKNSRMLEIISDSGITTHNDYPSCVVYAADQTYTKVLLWENSCV
jgi:hypothetical protein